MVPTTNIRFSSMHRPIKKTLAVCTVFSLLIYVGQMVGGGFGDICLVTFFSVFKS